jgi:hypothetical protein
MVLYIAVGQFAPDLIPYGLRPPGLPMMSAQGPGRGPQDGLVVVLQQEPTAPAFLLTLDTQKRMLTVRRVSATPETGRSYELWLISSRSPSPRSLGIVGNDEFTQRALPGNFDANTLRAASYAVSLEPAGGSTTGAPTGPILFTGKAVSAGNAKDVKRRCSLTPATEQNREWSKYGANADCATLAARSLAAVTTKSADGRQTPGHGCGLPGLDERRSAEIDIADLGEYADCRDQCRAQKADDHDLQMSAPIGAIHRMIHGVPPVIPGQGEWSAPTAKGELSGSRS